MKLRNSAKLIVAATVLALVSACGGGGDRPSKDEVADAIRNGSSPMGSGEDMTSLPDETIDCMAGALVDSDLSDDALRAFVKGDDDYEASDDDQAAVQSASTAMMSCVSAS